MSLAADRAPSPLTKSASVPEPENMSRDAIARSLGSKDALFFRQTADRGTNSAAYRKNQVEDTDVVDLSANKMRLHGLVGTSRQEGVEEEKEEPATSSPLASPPPSGVGKPRVQTPVGQSNTVNASQMFSPAGSPESGVPYSSATLCRPGSPTKGVGSFVQSAMAKRSDSVSKRWSAQTSPSVSRANSVAASRNNVGGSPESREKHGVDLIDPQSPEQSSSVKDDVMASPSSPSKRFSPVKASWLESALTRPESPKVSTGPQQPSWMAELHKNRIQRSSVDVTSAMKESGMDKVTSSTLNGGRTLPENKGQPMLPEKKPKPSVLEKPSDAPKEDVSEKKNIDPPLYSSGSVKGKPKPVTPPKKDFRSTLKPREQPADSTDKSELEFRNAAGKLKRTVTEKYVAPDILKDNITRGKAGLALTDGPQKSPTKDEFKDSLLKQKETMQTKGGESSRSRSTSPVKRSTTPEAIARRRTLANKASAPNLKAVAASEAAEEVERKQELQAPSARSIVSPQPLRKETVASSKLAERFNPNLASILARGPSPFVPSEAPGSPSTSARPAETKSASPEAGDNRPLQHMTKARAKGPKRRAPKTETPAVAAKQESRPPMPRKSSSDVRAVSTHKPRVASSSRRVTPSFASAESEPEPGIALSDRRKSLTSPTQTSKDDQTTNGADSTLPTVKSPSSALPPKPSKPNGLRSISGTQTSSIIEIDENTEKVGGKEIPASNNDISGLSVRGAAAKWGRPMTMEKKKEVGPLSSPIDFNSTKAQRSTSSSSLLVPTNEINGQKLATSPRPPQPAAMPTGLGSSAVKTPITTQSNGKHSTTSSTSSPIPRTTEAGRLIGAFFQNPSNARTHLDVDTSTIVATGLSQDTSKLKTLRKIIVEVHHDGTTSSLPLQQDHVLYSASMYLCTHIFGSASTGARTTEVYLWTGIDVPATHIPSAVSYATSEAQKASATFIHLLQGEEVTNFLQALGGILVTRNGSYSATQKSSYLLRGRRHFGHLTFDEVNLVTTSLCPGFPCILVPGTSPDKIYLWKGAGAHHEEVAGARLMAMDTCSLADIIEVDCGAENAEFLSLFPNANVPSKPSGYAPYWSQKSKSENYRVRLFQVSSTPTSSGNEPLSTVSAFWRAAAGKAATTANSNSSNPASTASHYATTVTEISPFSQSSLLPSDIYVLDAFFALYILIGPLARDQFQAFSSALLFARITRYWRRVRRIGRMCPRGGWSSKGMEAWMLGLVLGGGMRLRWGLKC